MRTAAHWDELVGEEGDPLGEMLPGPFGASIGGIPFLPDWLVGARLIVKIGFGADLTQDASTWPWTDVSTDVQQDNGQTISITAIGRQNGSVTAGPARATLTLDNRAGLYSQYNAQCSNWPNVRENTPLWVQLYVDGGLYTRFFGEIKTFTPGWDTTGNYAVTKIEAAGITRRLDLDSSPLHSAIYRATVAASPAPMGYWEMAEGSDVTQSSCTLPASGPPLTGSFDIFGNPSPKWGSGQLAPWLPPGVDFKGGGTSQVRPGTMPGSWANTAGWTVDVVVNLGSDRGTNLTEQPVLYVTGTNSATTVDWDLELQPAGVNPTDRIELIFYEVAADLSSSTATLQATITSQTLWDNRPHHLRLSVAQSGANIAWSVAVDGTTVASGTVASKTLQAPSMIEVFPQAINDWPKYVAGDLTLWSTSSPPNLAAAVQGYAGETATTRLARLGGEEGVSLATAGPYASDATMGPQGVDTFMTLLREVEAADSGFLYDGFSAGLLLQGLGQRYNQGSRLTLDASPGANQIVPPFEPAPDDYGRVNLMRVDRKDGSYATFEDTAGPLGSHVVGTYSSTMPSPVNYADDRPLYSRASWEVHTRTHFGYRYPTITIDLRRIPAKAAAWLSMAPGAAFTVTPPYTAQHPAGDLRLIAEGWSETLSNVVWVATINCNSAEEYDVFKVGDSRLGRVSPAGSELAADAASGATTLTTSKTAGYLWTTTATHPGDFPFDVEISGIQVTVTAITSNLNSNPYFESSVSPWSGQNGATVTRDGTQFHEGAWSMLVTPDGATAVPQAQSEQFAVVAGRSYTFSAWLRTTSNATRVAGIYWYDAAGVFISANTVSQALVAGVWTQYGPIAYTAPAGAVYARIKTNDPGTPAAGNPWWIDEATVTDATTQVFTVTGVTKALHAGDTVKLWKPGVIGK